MADHWWWRPGWRHGRRMYYWHVTFPEAPGMQALAAAARERLAGLPGMDLVPAQWLHLTAQAIGFTDEVSDADLAAIAGAARRRLARVAPTQVVIGPARVITEGIVCDVRPAGSLAPARDALRAAIGDVRGPARVRMPAAVRGAGAEAPAPARPRRARHLRRMRVFRPKLRSCHPSAFPPRKIRRRG